MVLTQYGVTAGAGVCFPDLGDFLGIKSFFPFPCLLSGWAHHTLLLSSSPFLPPPAPCVCLPSSHRSVQEGWEGFGIEIRVGSFWPLGKSAVCIIEDTDVGSYCEVVGERSVQGLESPGLLGEVCVSCILQRGRVHGSPSTRASPGTWERYALWEAAHQLSVARPPSLGVILRPHKCAVLSACFLKTLYASQLLPGVRTERRDTGDEVCPESSIRR